MKPEERFARNLRAERHRLDWSQEDLAAACRRRMAVSEVSRLERATREPRLSTIMRLARALSVPPAKLLDRVK